MNLFARNIVVSVLACSGVAAIVLACGSTGESTFNDGKLDDPSFPDGGGFGEGGQNQDDLYKNDPPPPYCGPDGGGTAPPPITGTLDCPDDKNKPGCACTTIGETKPCWTGLRKHRNLGVCKDGTTKCIPRNENLNVWAACEGQVLPTVGGKGKDACACFSEGEWKIANTSPCQWSNQPDTDPNRTFYSYSTVYTGGQATYCDVGQHVNAPETVPPVVGGIWSTDTLKVDCAGTFRLCFKIRAGDYNAPKGTDCTLGEACIDADYKTADVVQDLPPLPLWAGKDQACAKTWETTAEDVSPGYGEMIVKGKTVACDIIDDGSGGDFVFKRVQYCPRVCRTNASHPACAACQLASSGTFP